ncbi:MAG: PhoU domain-containing protein [Candidatus Bathyarchaeia archaeon]
MMELRKIQETGGGTLVVSLPKNWAVRNNLRKGSVVSLGPQPDGRLIIDPSYEKPLEPSEFTISYPTERASFLRWTILGGYLLGYDVIKIQGENRIRHADRERMKKTIRRLIGLEILDEDAYTISAQCVLDPSLLAPKKIIGRMNTITLSMREDSISSLLEADEELARALKYRDDEVDRLYFLAVRLLRSAVGNPKLAEKFDVLPVGCLDYRVAAHLIESIGDYSVQIAEVGSKMPKMEFTAELKRMFHSLSSALVELQRMGVDTLLTEESSRTRIRILGEIRDRHSELSEISESLGERIAKEPEGLIPYLSTVSSLLDKIGGCCIDIADLAAGFGP